MSELIQPRASANMRHQWLATVSALSLVTVLSTQARAEDTDHPTLWIELGGQLERITTADHFTPPFLQAEPQDYLTTPPRVAEKPPHYAYGAEGKLTFAPEHSNWLFSAAIRYGRSSNNKHVHESPRPYNVTNQSGYMGTVPPIRFADTVAMHEQSHAVVDFQAGRDVGLGLFGRNARSTLNAGVRFAQFSSKSEIAISSDPDLTSNTIMLGGIAFPLKYHHTYFARETAERSFHGVGPSLSWSSTVPLVGDGDDSEIALDIGLNGAVLFGRQKVHVHHETRAQYYNQKYALAHLNPIAPVYTHTPPDRTDSRSVTVPNIGAFAGVSFLYASAKVTFGYRADFFFGAVDAGIDARRTKDLGFHGPFATISIGLGG